MTFEQQIDITRSTAASPEILGAEMLGADILTFANHGAAPLKLALIGGFAPRKCGIATFTTDLFEQLAAHQPRIASDVWAIEDPEGPPADERVCGRIVSNSVGDYHRAAQAINRGSYDAIWLQH